MRAKGSGAIRANARFFLAVFMPGFRDGRREACPEAAHNLD
jgi:hypothetical protein